MVKICYKHLTILMLLIAITATQHVNFTIHIPAAKPLYMESNSKTIIFSGGTLSVINGVNILSYP